MPCSQIDVDIDLTTRQYIPEDSELHTRRHENLKSHIVYVNYDAGYISLELCIYEPMLV
jgi:hypothetical protein